MPVRADDRRARHAAVQELFRRATATGELVDAPVIEQHDLASGTVSYRLAVPRGLRLKTPLPPKTSAEPATQFVRFYFRGPVAAGIKHAATVAAEAGAAGHPVTPGRLLVIPLSLWADTPGYLAEYRLEIQ